MALIRRSGRPSQTDPWPHCEGCGLVCLRIQIHSSSKIRKSSSQSCIQCGT